MIDFIDLFAGVGGFHLGLSRSSDNPDYQAQVGEGSTGLQQHGNSVLDIGIMPDSEEYRLGQVSNGFRCVWANEWDKYASKVYATRFPETPLSTDDIRKVPADSIPDHQLLCAGFPCQAFSVAGKRRGLEEARGTLFYEIARIAERKRPRILLLENVKGLLSHDEGRSFATILRVLGSVGYRCEWQVLNSKWFGVPQNRERVIIIGHLGEEPRGTVFPITEIGGNSVESQGEARGDGSRVWDEDKGIAGSLRVGGSGLEDNLIAGTLSHRYGKDGSENLIQIYDAYNHSSRQEIGAVKTNEASPTSSSNLIMFERKHGWAGGDKDLPCVRVEGIHSQMLKSPSRIRRLTPLECERLQGFPDGWTEGVSDTQRYKQMGNAVTVNVIRFLGRYLQSILASERKVEC